MTLLRTYLALFQRNGALTRLLAGEFKTGETVRVDVGPEGTLTFNGSAEAPRAARPTVAPGSSPRTVH